MIRHTLSKFSYDLMHSFDKSQDQKTTSLPEYLNYWHAPIIVRSLLRNTVKQKYLKLLVSPKMYKLSSITWRTTPSSIKKPNLWKLSESNRGRPSLATIRSMHILNKTTTSATTKVIQDWIFEYLKCRANNHWNHTLTVNDNPMNGAIRTI